MGQIKNGGLTQRGKVRGCQGKIERAKVDRTSAIEIYSTSESSLQSSRIDDLRGEAYKATQGID